MRRNVEPAIVLLLTALMLLTASGAARAAKPVRILVVLSGGGGPKGAHDGEKNWPYLERVLRSAGKVEVTKLAPAPGQATGAYLARLADLKPREYDALVFYTVGQSLSPQQESALQRFVERGGGLVAIHGASASFGNSEAWFRLIGCRF